MRIVIIGATSAIAEHCARFWVSEKEIQLLLVGRNRKKLNFLAADLRVRSPKSQIEILQIDFFDAALINKEVESFFSEKIDIALIAQGALLPQHSCQEDLVNCKLSLEINGVSPILFAEAFAKNFAKQSFGTLAVISSVAADRSRKSLYIYGAAKAMLSYYIEGLQQRFSSTLVKVILIKPGPTDTPMTAHLKDTKIPLAPVDKVAKRIVKGISQGKTLIYAPRVWFFIMGIVRRVPRFILNRFG